MMTIMVFFDSNIKLNADKSFYLDGEAGRGKTHYLYALVKESILKNKKPHVFRDFMKSRRPY